VNDTEKKLHGKAIRRVGLFRYLDDELFHEMAAIAQIVTYAEGQRIVAEGELDSHVYALLSGSANVLVSARGATLVRIGRDDLFSFIHRHPSAGIRVLYVLIFGLLHKLREANQELAFERKGGLRQEDVDSIVEEAMKRI
jgi:CRP-like cAMP-binding protein